MFVYLCNVWHQVVRDTLRILTDDSRWVSSNGVEVSEQHCTPILESNRHKLVKNRFNSVANISSQI